jgi:hypothetical protein
MEPDPNESLACYLPWFAAGWQTACYRCPPLHAVMTRLQYPDDSIDAMLADYDAKAGYAGFLHARDKALAGWLI